MSTFAADVESTACAQAELTNKSRLDIGEEVVGTMKGAAKVAIIALGMAAQISHNVPYLGAISTALAEFMKMQDEVDQCKDDCRTTVADARQMNSLIETFRDKCVKSGLGDGVFDGSLRDAFSELEKIILECILTLEKCKVDSKRKRDRFRRYLKRSELAKSVKDCAAKMGKARQDFHTTLQVDQAIILEEMRRTLNKMHEAQTFTAVQVAAPEVPSVWRLRAANPIFYGRELEVEAAVDLIVNKSPARVAILGPGGIGKTSIALAVLHHESVNVLYGDRRCFMSCEATTTADAVVRALADALGLTLGTNLSTGSARHSLMQSLDRVSGIICIDNLETPLDVDKRAVEELLHDISALPSVALLTTSRDTSIPTLKWTSPRLDHVKPFSREAALATWDDICDIHNEYTEKLVQAVDCMPLAVTLLARLASIERSTKLVWDRWEAEHTDMISDGDQDDRLYSVSASIELSLSHRAEASALLGILCIFPDGFEDNLIALLEGLNDRREPVASSLSLLKRLSLVYTEVSSWNAQIQRIYVLSPIRHHVQQHHVSDELFLELTDIVMQYPDGWGMYHDAIVTFGWNRPLCHKRCLQMVISFPGRTLNIKVLSQAIGKARELEPQIQSRLHRQLGYALHDAREFEKARFSFSQAIEIDEQLGDRKSLFKDWTAWIWTFRDEFGGREDECQLLDEVQNAIEKAWELGRDDSGVWDQGYWVYNNLADAQHFVNKGRRKRHMPVVHRSGLYSDNDSTLELDFKDCVATYKELVMLSSPPWDLRSILETIETLHSAREEITSEGCTVSSGNSVHSESRARPALEYTP
ncbi:hypothetical protein PENSPDRAFT_83753 [Peniophora sp. CONT]|nr:hypothetical protein PENSPDRAFT_83753 [Peniophora sp. CONT]